MGFVVCGFGGVIIHGLGKVIIIQKRGDIYISNLEIVRVRCWR